MLSTACQSVATHQLSLAIVKAAATLNSFYWDGLSIERSYTATSCHGGLDGRGAGKAKQLLKLADMDNPARDRARSCPCDAQAFRPVSTLEHEVVRCCKFSKVPRSLRP